MPTATTTNRPKFEIHLTRYNTNWKEETIILGTGSIKQQMLDLMRGLRDRQGEKAIVMYLFDTTTGEASNEHRF